MKGFQLTFALLASAALGLGQTAGSPAPTQGTPPANYPVDHPQNSRPDMVSPGTINYVEGQVSVDNRPLGSAGQITLQPNQILTTGNGFAEILLTPGSFLRVGHDSQVRLMTSGLADTKAQLDRGTALVEVDQLVKGTSLAVLSSGATTQLDKKGLYDFDADQQAIRVLDGKATVIEAAGTKTIGKDDQLLLASANPLKKTDFDVKAVKTQPLYVWSQVRSQTESQANVTMARNVRAYGGWNGPGWYWNPYLSFYSFLPGDGFLYSPFGLGFYSPAYFGFYGGYGLGYGRGFYGRPVYYGGGYGRVGGVSAHVSSFHGGGHR